MGGVFTAALSHWRRFHQRRPARKDEEIGDAGLVGRGYITSGPLLLAQSPTPARPSIRLWPCSPRLAARQRRGAAQRRWRRRRSARTSTTRASW